MERVAGPQESLHEDLESMDLSEDAVAESEDGTMILGEKGCPAFKANESACVDLFFNVVPSSKEKDIHKYIEAAWVESRETTLKLVFNLGNVRKDGAGKQDRSSFYQSLLWLWRQEPEIVIKNTWLIHQHSSLKCLLNLVMYIVHLDQDTPYSYINQHNTKTAHSNHKSKIRTQPVKRERRIMKQEHRLAAWNRFAQEIGKTSYEELRKPRSKDQLKGKDAQVLADPRVYSQWINDDIAAKFQEFVKQRDVGLASQGKVGKKEERRRIVGVIKEVRSRDNVKLLYKEVVKVFVDGLLQEMEDKKKVEAGVAKSVGGLYSKWAPKEKGMHDKATGLAKEIMNQLLPKLGKTVERASQQYQSVLSSIHEVSQVPEHYVGTGRWNEVNYNRMASRCRLLWGTKVFKAHDEARYDEYLTKSAVTALTDKAAKDGVKTGSLLPHELVQKVGTMEQTKDVKMEKMELNLQWWGLVKSTMEALRAGEGLGYCLPMCDVSGSMDGTPMDVSIALSMLLAESVPRDSALHGKILTFESKPSLCQLKQIPDYDLVVDQSNLEDVDSILKQLGDFGARVAEVKAYGWGGSTNIEAAFDLLLDVAKSNNLSREFVEGMCLVIFSDMEFDQAIHVSCYNPNQPDSDSDEDDNSTTPPHPWTTMHKHITHKFQLAGYPKIPKTVYWNLRASRSQPVKGKEQQDVVLLSGFSSGLLKSFLKGNWDDFSPLAQMLQAISGPMYQLLVAK